MRYLLFATLAYAYPILRPLQAEIRRRGHEAAWLLEPSCPDLLQPGERRLQTLDEAVAYRPDATFAPGNFIPDFLPGLKVSVFHGYPINKRGDAVDDHFRLRGWFDIYCTQGPSSTIPFRRLEARHRYFRVYETGWAKADNFFTPAVRQLCEQRLADPQRVPTILVATTFSRNISSLAEFLPHIRRMAVSRPWRWLITLHPKLRDAALIDACRQLAAEHANVEFKPVLDGVDDMARTDVLLCDSSSIIIEYMLLDKPVVTLRNTSPGPHLLNVSSADDIEAALAKAIARPLPLMEALRAYSLHHEPHRDGQNAARILDAVDDFVAHWQGRLPRKPLNLLRRLKLRWKLRRWYPLFA